jgi:hypothetical protein
MFFPKDHSERQVDEAFKAGFHTAYEPIATDL